jgi:hypothetical protein
MGEKMSKREVVLNENGEALDYFVFSVSQKIGLPNYSSIDIFASIGRSVEDNVEARKEVVLQVEELVEAEVANIKENLGVS